MFIPSLTTILGCVFIVYILHSMWSMLQLFKTLECSSSPCFTSYIAQSPKLQLGLFTSTSANPSPSDVTTLQLIRKFDYEKPFVRNFKVDIPSRTRRNGTLIMHAVLALDDVQLEWKNLKRDGPTIIQRVSLTEYAIPKAATFNLLGENENENNRIKDDDSKKKIVKPVSHFIPKVFITMLTDKISMSQMDIPPEMARLVRVNRNFEFLPIVQRDFFKTRLKDLVEINRNTTAFDLEFNYNPISIGKLRLMLQIEHATKSMELLGFSKKDVDEVKGIFSDTNVYLLCGTVFIGSIHILFDFLSFKNDVMFWRRKRNYAGLSMRTTIWRAFSQIVIFLYLLDENTSMIVLIPAGIGTLIELWKCKKILKIEISWFSIKMKSNDGSELATQDFDKEAMRYLSYLLYPLCIGGAVYSLIYQPHKSWYSWTLSSLVNGVYAFGFLFMLPQLFVNYKCKSVAALPYRAFMYKAFNTFIDDIFAFIITMPTAHRVACFRDDVVFIIYLYQRWLYPVDKTRMDTGADFEDIITDERKELSDKKLIEKEKKDK